MTLKLVVVFFVKYNLNVFTFVSAITQVSTSPVVLGPAYYILKMANFNPLNHLRQNVAEKFKQPTPVSKFHKIQNHLSTSVRKRKKILKKKKRQKAS